MKRKLIPKISLFTIWEIAKRIGILALVGLFFGLLYSVIQSGYHYQFDIDELFFTQYAYLYAHGFRPYLDVYTSVYPPIFQWITMPAFLLKGFTFDGIYTARMIMIGLYVLRLGFSFLFIKAVFNKRTAIFFLPLLLFDPFAVFTSMQYRPDNLMLVLYTVGLLLFVKALTNTSQKHMFFAGVSFGAAILVLSKILPSVIVTSVILCIYCLIKRQPKPFITLLIGLCVPFLLFALYLLSQGMLQEAIRQILEVKFLYSNFVYPIPINSLLKPDNIFIYGTMGKPITWVYALCLAPLGVAGLYHAMQTIVVKSSDDRKKIIILILGISLLCQWATLFIVQVAFMQHYMPVNWLFALFGAYAIDEMLMALKPKPFWHNAGILIIVVIFVNLSLASMRYNLFRSSITAADQIQGYQARWKQIPPEEAVFPSYFLRPSLYPVIYGGFIVNFPSVILNRLPNIPQLLEIKRPRLLLDDYTLFRLPDDAQIFINAHYERVPGDNELMVWKK
jgi:Dolichyl-phosphate-mannose-protein mannosyltransferase